MGQRDKCTRHGRLVRQGLWVLHRLKLKTTLSSGCARVSEAEGICDGQEGGVHEEVPAAALAIVLIKERFPEFLFWHLRALPRIPLLKLLLDFQGKCNAHTQSLISFLQTHSPSSTGRLFLLLTGKGGCGGWNNDRADYN